MRPLSSLAIGLSSVSCFLFLALVAELYYLLWWKKKIPNREIDESGYISPTKEFLYFFCWKKPNSLSSTALNPQEIATDGSSNDYQRKDLLIPFEEEGMEAELMRLHSLSGPPRFLFTIKEETKEDLESDDGRSRGGKSRRSSRGRSLSDVLLNAETPFWTPLSSPPAFFTPPLTPMDCYKQQGSNPLFESKNYNEVMNRVKASPPPKFKFLRDAEEKLYKKTLTEEAMRVHKFGDCIASPSKSQEEEDGSFITIIIGKNREKGHLHQHHPSSSQVNPLPSPPIIRPVHGKLGSYLSSGD